MALGNVPGRGLLMHELGHAIGPYHEHQRQDCDAFVTYVPYRVQSGRAHNFEKRLGVSPTAYDQRSIMHYVTNTFSISACCPTLIAKNGGALGGGTLTASDIAGLNWLAGL